MFDGPEADGEQIRADVAKAESILADWLKSHGARSLHPGGLHAGGHRPQAKAAERLIWTTGPFPSSLQTIAEPTVPTPGERPLLR